MEALHTAAVGAEPVSSLLTPGWERTNTLERRITWVLLLGAVAVTAATVLIADSTVVPHPVASALARAALAGSAIAVGSYVWWRQSGRFGVLLVGLGFVYVLTALNAASDPLAYTFGRAANGVLFVYLAYTILCFPGGHLQGRAARATVAGYAAASLVVWLAMLMVSDVLPTGGPFVGCVGACPSNPLRVVGAGHTVISALGLVAAAAAAVAFSSVTVLFALRLRGARGLERRTAAPALAAAGAFALCCAAYFALRRAGAGAAADTIGAAGVVVILGFPYLILLGMHCGRMFAGAAVSQLIRTLAEHDRAPAQMEAALARALEDPTLRLAFPRRDQIEQWVDTDGQPTQLPAAGEGHVATLIGPATQPNAAMVHEPMSEGYPGLLQATVAVATLAIRNARLEAEQLATLAELRASRQRVLTAADNERRRLERDLHDGAQQHLIALRISLGLAADLVARDPQSASELLGELSDEAQNALDELRDLVHGIYPPILVDAGPAAALESAARECALPVSVEAAGVPRLDPQLEAAVFFTCLEAMQNAVKHGGPDAAVAIQLRERGEQLRFAVSDSGRGFEPARVGRSGLMNMRERVIAAGGEIEISSAPGHGTTVAGWVPAHRRVDGLRSPSRP